MRGGAGASLFVCDDGFHYVVKPWNNPQGNRTLVNEVLAGCLLREMGIAAPPMAFVLAGDGGASPPHFGSRFPGLPAALSVYDYLPDRSLAHVVNLDHFLGALVFDKWVSNADSRQAIFYRARVALPQGESIRWVAQMVDNGHAFQGTEWDFSDSPGGGACRQRFVYRGKRLSDFEYWLDVLAGLKNSVFEQALARLPEAWLQSDRKQAGRLLARLAARRQRVRELVAESLPCLQE